MAESPIASPGGSGLGRHLDLGLLRLGGVDLAVPVDWVREVVPCPRRLGPCFGRHPALIGSIGVRGDVIPVIDITVLLGFGDGTGCGGTIAVLRHEGALLGLRVDSVLGLQRVSLAMVRALFDSEGATRLVDRAFVRDQQLVGILDPASLFAMPGLPLVRGASAAEDTSALGSVRALVLVTVAGVQIAIDSQLVESTAPATSLRPCAVPAPGWGRSVSYLGRDVRVFDQLSTLGLEGATPEEATGPVVLLRIAPGRLVGWHVEAVRSVARIPVDRIGPLPAAIAARDTLFSGVATDSAHGQNLVLDSDAVRADSAIAAMAALCRPLNTAGGANSLIREKASGADAFLVFDTGARMLAVPLEGICEVVPFAGLSSRVGDANGLCGLGDYRGSPVSVYTAEPGGDPADGRLLIIARGGDGAGMRGVLARRLATIVNAAPRPVPGGSPGTQFVPAMVDGMVQSVRIHALA